MHKAKIKLEKKERFYFFLYPAVEEYMKKKFIFFAYTLRVNSCTRKFWSQRRRTHLLKYILRESATLLYNIIEAFRYFFFFFFEGSKSAFSLIWNITYLFTCTRLQLRVCNNALFFQTEFPILFLRAICFWNKNNAEWIIRHIKKFLLFCFYRYIYLVTHKCCVRAII